jgi:hypothetical protein
VTSLPRRKRGCVPYHRFTYVLNTQPATYMCYRILYYKKPSKFCSQLWQTNKIQEYLVPETDGKTAATIENNTIQHEL